MQNFFKKFVTPVSQIEDEARREFILNVLLLAIIGLSFFASVINLSDQLRDHHPSFSAQVIFIIFSFFIFLYFLSRRGFFRSASYLFLGAFFLPVSYAVYMYGVDLPAELLSYALIIVMAGILIDTNFAFLTTAAVIVTMSSVGYAEHLGILKIDHSWRSESEGLAGIIIFFTLFFIIAVVSWLANREIEKSLARARGSEADLKKERDSLEITVEERTRELKETQVERIAQLYRFAEFGRLSSGLFHDLVNPLTAVSLNIEKIQNKENTYAAPISEVAEYVNRAVAAAKKMEDMVGAVRRQLARQESKALFSLNQETQQAIAVLAFKALKAKVAVHFSSGAEIKIFGDAIKFNQVALNLIANAIEAYQGAREQAAREVIVSLDKRGGEIVFEVRDGGVGISEENKLKLFEPFFTTKAETRGIGIGLSITKRIIEKDFDGSIEVISKEGSGSVFTVKFPQTDNG